MIKHSVWLNKNQLYIYQQFIFVCVWLSEHSFSVERWGYIQAEQAALSTATAVSEQQRGSQHCWHSATIIPQYLLFMKTNNLFCTFYKWRFIWPNTDQKPRLENLYFCYLLLFSYYFVCMSYNLGTSDKCTFYQTWNMTAHNGSCCQIPWFSSVIITRIWSHSLFLAHKSFSQHPNKHTLSQTPHLCLQWWLNYIIQWFTISITYLFLKRHIHQTLTIRLRGRVFQNLELQKLTNVKQAWKRKKT